MWDLPRPGLEPVSPALAGRFSTTAPPGKPQQLFIKYELCTGIVLDTRDTLVNRTDNIPALMVLNILIALGEGVYSQ